MTTLFSSSHRGHLSSQYLINVAVFVFVAALLVGPSLTTYFLTVYTGNIAGLIPLVGYWYSYNVIKEYFFDS